jgi:hypothetical protein
LGTSYGPADGGVGKKKISGYRFQKITVLRQQLLVLKAFKEVGLIRTCPIQLQEAGSNRLRFSNVNIFTWVQATPPKMVALERNTSQDTGYKKLLS